MSHSIAIKGHGHFGDTHPSRHKVVVGALLALALGIVALATSELYAASVHAVPPRVESVTSYAPRELPRDWRWERQPVQYEHMYRNHETPKLDWIREGRR